MKQKFQPIRVLIADDHPTVRDGLAFAIGMQPDMTVVAEAADGKEAVQLFRERKPDVVLLDLRMPGMDGLEALKSIRSESPDVRALVFTTYDGDEDIYRSLQAGAKGYLLKDSPRQETLRAIRAVAAGEDVLPPALALKVAKRVGKANELTTRECEVLSYIAKGKSNKEIGAILFVCEGTIKAHVNNILAKLGASGRTEAVTLAIKRGLIRLP
jgi:two-component system, NarL family, response regulator